MTPWCVEGSLYRKKSTVAALRSTLAVRLSAPIHARACTWDNVFAHHGR